MITPERWAKEMNKLVDKAPSEMTPEQKQQWADQEMRKRYRMRTRRKS